MIRYRLVLLENSGKRNGCIQDCFSLDGKLLVHDHVLHGNAVKIRNCLVSLLRAFYENAVSVKINVAVQIRNTANRLFFFYTDADGISVYLTYHISFHKGNVLCLPFCVKKRRKNGI